MSSPLNVLYVMGSGHSGSTLLDMMLGEIPEFLSCGEVVKELAPRDVAVVSSTTFPLLTRYGYAYRTTSLER